MATAGRMRGQASKAIRVLSHRVHSKCRLRSAGCIEPLLVAAAVTSFWRGAWYVMDAVLFPGDLLRSGLASLGIGWASFTVAHKAAGATQAAGPDLRAAALRTPPLRRLAVLYCLGLSVVSCWRGVWVLWDGVYERLTGTPATQDALASGLASHALGLVVVIATGHLASVTAPPALIAVITDAGAFSGVFAPYFGSLAILFSRRR
uniref:Uncharacterized protein n=1 Tax=Alexandrium monilatum TaxID=311494 RepID=A0A7S4Q3F5_9DINO